MKIIGYTYDADFHCPPHTTKRFPLIEEPPGDVGYRDSEDNFIHPVFDTDEWDTAQTCPECLNEFLSGTLSELPAFDGNVIGEPDEEAGDEATECSSCGALLYENTEYPWHLPNEDCRAVREPVKPATASGE